MHLDKATGTLYTRTTPTRLYNQTSDYWSTFASFKPIQYLGAQTTHPTMKKTVEKFTCAVENCPVELEIAVGHWPFSDQSQDLADKN